MLTKKYYGQTGYFQKGANPKLLILSGMHGDEAETSHLLHKYLSLDHSWLPDFVYIPFLSPTAIATASRENSSGHDLNRSFLSTLSDPEAIQIANLLKNYRFNLAVDFHEDRDRTTGFYMFDEILHEKSLVNFDNAQQKLQSLGLRMFNGIEDMEDPNLGYNVSDGYIQLTKAKLKPDVGFLSFWLLEQQIIERMFTIEIPKRANHQTKNQIFPIILDLAIDNLNPQG
jgi:hypothetical protein